MGRVTININGILCDVASAEEGARVWCEIRDRRGLGASDMTIGCGDVRDESGGV